MARTRPSRFQPTFEALEDRSLMAAGFGINIGSLVHNTLNNAVAQVTSAARVSAPAHGAALTSLQPSSFYQSVAEGALSGAARNALLQILQTEHPNGVLYDGRDNWGHTSRVVTGYKPVWQGLHSHLEPIYGNRNDGLWTHTVVSLGDPNHFELQVQNLRVDSAGTLTFQVYVSAELRFATDAVYYQSGYKLGAVDAAGRVRVNLTINMEAKASLQAWTLPSTASFAIRATGAQANFDNLVFDRIGHLGGVSANLLGAAVKRIIDQWKPSLIRNGQSEAQQSVVRALQFRKDVPISQYLVQFYNAVESEYAKNFHESLW
jgi:hypothetical protein